MPMPGSNRSTTRSVAGGQPETLALRYRRIRQVTEQLCQPLAVDDYGVQAMPDVSPPKWHLAHTTWFFEAFILSSNDAYRKFHPKFARLFNSYYEGVGECYPRTQRGWLSRPTVEEVLQYRAYVDQQMAALLDTLAQRQNRQQLEFLVELGLNHEQQHQELLLTDLKYNFSVNPLEPVYRALSPATASISGPLRFIRFDGGIQQIGHAGDGFAFDNEAPRHRVFIEPYCLANRPVTNGEFLEFITAGGYRNPQHWLSDGWQTVKSGGWQHPLYWRRIDDEWRHLTLGGVRLLDLHEPVCHISYYEADAFARWAGKRLPTEAEWEHAAGRHPLHGNFLESGGYHPVADDGSTMFFGNVWQWTRSPYMPYPGFCALSGTLGEYNGKFMSNQMVLRGGSCVTPADHIRATYRNFFYPWQRWQFSGVRLADKAL